MSGLESWYEQNSRRDPKNSDYGLKKMNEDQKYTPPEKSVGDAVHAVARAGLGAIPVAGAAASELLIAIVSPPLEKRRSEWMAEVGEALRKLEEQMGVVLESLQTN